MPFIEIKEMFKAYHTPAGEHEVLRHVNLNVEKGDFVAIYGPSGSGKTTFLNMLTGIDTPTKGEVVIDGVPINRTKQGKLTKWRGKNAGIVFQFFQLLPTLTVVENVVAPMDFCNVWKPSERKDRAMELLDRFGIADQAHKTPDMLSGGQQQRVAVARALANDPPLIVADEPTGNLDRMSATNVFNFFRELSENGRTVVVVTHDRELVQTVPKLLEIREGEIGETTLEKATKRRTQELEALRVQGRAGD